jgi:hypothetical protein
MDGVELAPGAALWQVTQAGQERCLGRYQLDAAGTARWTTVPAR